MPVNLLNANTLKVSANKRRWHAGWYSVCLYAFSADAFTVQVLLFQHQESDFNLQVPPHP